eukprot:gene10063-2233_t
MSNHRQRLSQDAPEPRDHKYQNSGEHDTDDILPSWLGPVVILAFAVALAWFDIELWKLFSTIIKIALIIITLYMPRMLLISSTNLGSMIHGSLDSAALDIALSRRRLVASILLLASPLSQYYAIQYINSIKEYQDSLTTCCLNPGVIAICSSLYVLYTITADHAQEALSLTLRLEKANKLYRQVASIKQDLHTLQSQTDRLKSALQVSIHTISRVRCDETGVERQVLELSDRLYQLEKSFGNIESKQPSQSLEFLKILFAIEWPWFKLYRLLQVTKQKRQRTPSNSHSTSNLEDSDQVRQNLIHLQQSRHSLNSDAFHAGNMRFSSPEHPRTRLHTASV